MPKNATNNQASQEFDLEKKLKNSKISKKNNKKITTSFEKMVIEKKKKN